MRDQRMLTFFGATIYTILYLFLTKVISMIHRKFCIYVIIGLSIYRIFVPNN